MRNDGRLIRIVGYALGVLVIGTIGYMIIEGWSLSDAFFMTVITLSTVGYGVVAPLSSTGQIFTLVLILVGVGILVYSFSTFGEYLVVATMRREIQKRRTIKMIEKLRDHVVICGYGQVGRSTAKTLRDSKHKIVIIDSDKDRIIQAQEEGFLGLVGDASEDEILFEAGIENAKNIIVSTGDDSLNLFIVLSARAINPNLYIISRANNAANQKKLRRAGADRVVSPYQIGGQHMANIVVRPQVTDFFDVVTLKGGEELWIEESIISETSAIVGKTVGEADIRRKTGVTLVALYRHKEEGNTVPNAETELHVGDKMLVLGTREQLAVLEKLTNPSSNNV